MKKAVNVESNFFDISLKEQMLSVKKVGFDGVFFDWTDNEEFAENVNFAREIGLEIASIHDVNYDAFWEAAQDFITLFSFSK